MVEYSYEEAITLLETNMATALEKKVLLFALVIGRIMQQNLYPLPHPRLSTPFLALESNIQYF